MEDLRTCLCYRSVTIRDEKSLIPFTEEMAVNARDALAKNVYNHLFDFLVCKLNEELVPSDNLEYAMGIQHFIGVLDIFGFEVIHTNTQTYKHKHN